MLQQERRVFGYEAPMNPMERSISGMERWMWNMESPMEKIKDIVPIMESSIRDMKPLHDMELGGSLMKATLNFPLFNQRVQMMIADRFECFVDETYRLLGLQIEELNKALGVPNFLNKANSEDKTIDAKVVRKWIDDIENEKQKLTALEIVVAVVGTMKAGKSTTINAIVGMELLPSRETPMTTLPTLIRNKHGQSEPILKIPNIKPLEKLSQDISQKLHKLKNLGGIEKVRLHNTTDGGALISKLITQNGYHFETEYNGQNEISRFLKSLNDIMRLAKDEAIDIDVDPIYHKYGNTADLPVIEVEFCHLKGSEDFAQGSLSLLDTPGPNECGQSEALSDVFRTQLKKASAVFLIIDFTQMNSNAEADVRKELDNVKRFFSSDRLYVIVNRFDQANAGTMQEEGVREFVMDKLLADVPLNQEFIFPVSSLRAYLANRARNHVANHGGTLPSHTQDEARWVEDFARAAFGDGWEDELEDLTPARLEKKIKAVWDKSLFEQPIERAIKTAHSTAAQKSIDSAITKLSEYSREYLNVLNVRCRDMDDDIENLQKAMRGLEEDVARCKKVEQEVRSKSCDAMDQVKLKVDTLWTAQKSYLNNTIVEFFKNGMLLSEKELSDRLHEEIYNKAESFRERCAGIFGKDRRKQEFDNSLKREKKMRFDVSSPVIEFTSQHAAKVLMNDIVNNIQGIFTNAEKQVSNVIEELLSSSAEEITNIVNNNAKETLDRAKKKLNDKGIEIDFEIAPISLEVTHVSSSQLFDDSLEKHSRTIYHSRHRDTRFGKFCKWLGTSEYGKETYTITENSYKIHIHKIRDTTLTELSNTLNQLSNQTESHLEKEFQPKIDKKLSELVDYLQCYHGVISDSLDDSKLEQDDKNKLKLALTGLRKQAIKNKGDIDAVQTTLRNKT